MGAATSYGYEVAALRNRNIMLRLGRGWNVPPTFTPGGGMDWNCPIRPSEADIIHAGSLAIWEVVATAIGTEVLDRGHGTTVEQALQSVKSNRSAMDRLESSTKEAVESHCPFVSVLAVTAGFIIKTGRLILRILWQLNDSSSDNVPVVTSLSIGSSGIVEVTNG